MRPLRLADLTAAQVAAWAELAERAVEPNPFLHPDFVLAAARAEGVEREVGLVVADGTGDGWRACLPVRATTRWRHLPLPGTMAWLHDQCFLGTPLVGPEAPEEALGDLLRALRGQFGVFAQLDLADTGGPVGAALEAALPAGALRFGGFERAALERRPEPTYLDGRLSGKHRRALRRAGRDVAAELGGELELVERAGEAAAVDAFLDLEAAGWKGRRGTALASLPGGRRFLHEVCAGFAARGALQLLFLRAGGRTVAARVTLRAGGVLCCLKIAHDEGLRRFSPGMLMELRVLERFHADPAARRMDSCADPGSQMFCRLWADRRPLGGVLVPRRGVRGAAARPVLRAVAAAIDRRRAAAGTGRAATDGDD